MPSHMHPTDTWLTRAFEASYKESSAKSYVARMRMVVNKTQSDFFDVMTRPDHYWPAIRDTYYADSIGTRRAIATLVLAAFKLVPDDTQQHYAKQHARWRSLLKTTRTLDDAERAQATCERAGASQGDEAHVALIGGLDMCIKHSGVWKGYSDAEVVGTGRSWGSVNLPMIVCH